MHTSLFLTFFLIATSFTSSFASDEPIFSYRIALLEDVENYTEFHKEKVTLISLYGTEEEKEKERLEREYFENHTFNYEVYETDNPKKVLVKVVDKEGYVRTEMERESDYFIGLFHGGYVDRVLNKIIRGRLAPWHTNKTTVSGIEVGKYIAKYVFELPIDIAMVGGIARHREKGLQKDFNAYTVAIRFEYTKFFWSDYVRTKIEFAEGINYAEEVPYYEGIEVRNKNQGRDSRLLNYLGVGISVNLGDLLKAQELETCYVGGYAYHRSGVFATVDAYNNITGGSNFQTVKTECKF